MAEVKVFVCEYEGLGQPGTHRFIPPPTPINMH